MSDISARLDVLCPDHEATRHVAAYIDQHAVGAGVISVTLRLPLKMFAVRPPLLERRAYATLSALRSASDPHQTYSVAIAQKLDGTPPYFSGALAIHTSLADDCVGLVFAGHYHPPAGIGGTIFDFTLGHWIAQASASHLLRTIASYIEVASARNEAARAGKRAYRSLGADHRVAAGPAAALTADVGIGALLQ